MSNLSRQEYTINKESVSFNSYEEMAEHYFKYIDTKPWNAYYERPATTSLLPDVKGKKVLDAGGAAGWYTKWLLGNGADVMAIDFSPNMIEMTKKRVGNNAKIIRADLNNPLDFIEDKFLDLEPMPTEQFKIERPDIYEILTKRPQFLFIRAKKL